MVRKEVKVPRQCGFRKVGAIYLVGGLVAHVCDRLPFKLEPCPWCWHRHEFHRGITKTSGAGIFHGEHVRGGECSDTIACPVCYPSTVPAGLMWVGKRDYSPESFQEEATRMGVSKRLPRIPRWLVLNETWVFLAHQKAVEVPGNAIEVEGKGKLFHRVPGVFSGFIPHRIERIMTESQAEGLSQELIDKLDTEGIDIVTVPDYDPDHK